MTKGGIALLDLFKLERINTFHVRSEGGQVLARLWRVRRSSVSFLIRIVARVQAALVWHRSKNRELMTICPIEPKYPELITITCSFN